MSCSTVDVPPMTPSIGTEARPDGPALCNPVNEESMLREVSAELSKPGEVLTRRVSPALVFTEGFRRWLQRRYGPLPPYQRRGMYSLAFDPKCRSDRDNIEDAMRSLSPSDQLKLTERIQNPDLYLQASNELGASYIFTRKGCTTNYERSLAGLTPDWLVTSAARQPLLVVEVISRGPSEQTVREQRWMSRLIGRISEIPLGCCVEIEFSPRAAQQDDREINRVVGIVESWLRSTPGPEADSPLDDSAHSGLRFHVAQWNTGLKSTWCLRFRLVQDFPSIELTVRKLAAKARKYSGIASNANLPLVIAVFGGSSVWLDRAEFVRMLCGYYVYTTGESRSSYEQFQPNRQDGVGRLFVDHPELSAAVHVDGWPSSDPRALLVHNPYALRPLVLDS